MKIAIVGFDREGRASYDYFKNQGHEVSIFDADQSVKLPEASDFKLGPKYLDTIKDYDKVMRTPGLHPKKINSVGVSKDKIWSGTNEFFKVCPTKNIIGVTGTKGKGTTSSLITKILENSGKTVHLGGNIGTPALDLLKNNIKKDDWVVLELSNFQLIDLHSSPHIAVCLLIVPEHLDWHNTEKEYVESKQNIFAHQLDEDFAIYFAKNENSMRIALSSSGQKIPYYAKPGAYVENNKIVIDGITICETNDIALLGEHNWQNVCAAVTATWKITQDLDAIKNAIKEFTGLEHRIEFVRETNGIKFYNDSFATGLHATVAALNSVEEPKIAIIGGYDRLLPLEHFGEFIKNEAKNIKQILLIGASKERTAEMLDLAGVTKYKLSNATTMQEVISDAVTLAHSGDAIVLSPGFASFDMFSNFEERGKKFKEIVNSL
jgi:UDP-N-acetylmuramoylalanine--D-glutamate ligase